MTVLGVRRLTGAAPGSIIALQRHLLGLSGRERPSRVPILIFGECDAPSALLGRYQSYGPGRKTRPPDAVQRRITGGRAAAVGPGILWLSVVLPRLVELTTPNALPITPDRALNRYCRGVLRGLSSLGIPAFYPGQDCITVRRRPIALLSVDATPGGQALFDCVIAVNESMADLPPVAAEGGVPEPTTLRASTCTTLASELGRPLSSEEVIAAICRGYEDQSQMTVDAREPSPLEGQLLDVIRQREVDVAEWIYRGVPGPEHELHTSVSVQLGRFEVGCALQQRHFLTNVTFAGDFIATGDIVDALEKKLRLCPAEWKAIGMATDAVFHESYRTILGIGPRQTIPNTVMQAVEAALPQHASS